MIKDKNWITVALDKLVPAAWNYKKNDARKAEKLKNNIERNGQVENILVRDIGKGRYEVVNGNHRLIAFKDLELKEVVCYNFGEISDTQAQRVAIETNETKFETDDFALAKLISQIAEETDLSDLQMTMPFDDQELQDMINYSNIDWETFNNRKGDGEPSDPRSSGPKSPPKEPLTCPECGHIFPER